MTINNMQSRASQSVYALGAADGAWAGLAMRACFVLMVLSTTMPFAGLVSLGIFLCTPFLVWRFLRRGWIDGNVPPTFSAVWLHGICIFLFGSILLALVMYLTLQHFVPGWIEQQTLLAAERLAAEPGHTEEVRQIHAIVTGGALPSPIYMAFSTIWLVAFTGSLWSMLFAAILTRSERFRKLRANNTTKNG